MESDATKKAMMAVLACDDIGDTAAIFAALAIAREFEYMFYEKKEREEKEAEAIKIDRSAGGQVKRGIYIT